MDPKFAAVLPPKSENVSAFRDAEGLFTEVNGVVFYRGSFSQRGASSYWCPQGRGLGSGSGGWWGVVSWGKIREKREGVGRVGGGVGTGKGTGKSTPRARLSNLPFGKPPFSFSPN